jgi:hypothetical protein
MKYFFALLLLTSLKLQAQPYEDVKVPIKALFNGMRKSDTAMIRSAFTSNAILQTITKNKEGLVGVQTGNINEFIASIGKPRTDILDERIQYDAIKVDAELAIVWTPYKFYIGSKYSHCGVNSFQLVKINGSWKIQYLIDTRRKQCEGEWKPELVEEK